MRALLVSALLLLCVVVLHIVALNHFWYWRYPWVDIVAHGVGGVSLGLFMHWALSIQYNQPRILAVLIYTLVVCVAWECFEYMAGFTRDIGYAFDTTQDILIGLLGGTVGYGIARSI
ncbi:hypothetical protein EBR66_04680 [bacterium]|nr:hypothetical protein [bacterium]